jgi:hypothetical protein
MPGNRQKIPRLPPYFPVFFPSNPPENPQIHPKIKISTDQPFFRQRRGFPSHFPAPNPS